MHEDSFRPMGKILTGLVFALSMIWVLYHVYAAGFTGFGTLQHRAIFIGFGFSLIWILYAPSKRLKHSKLALIIDLILVVLTFAITIYVFEQFYTYEDRVGLPPTFWDIFFGISLFVLVIEAARRTLGLIFPALVILFILYGFMGPYLPAPFTHAGMDLQKMIGTFFISTAGPYGSITGVAANYIFLFIIFAAMIRQTAAGDFFKDFSLSLLGKYRGAPGKLAVVASGLMGMITGSGMANVAGAGSFTIPLMKKSGYKPEFAGGVETVSSMGAQIVPPIMGGSVFIMMEILGVPYWDIVVASTLVAILMYVALFFMIDFEAVKLGLFGLAKEETPNFRAVIRRGWFHIIPILLLIYMLGVLGRSPGRAAFWAIIAVPVINLIARTGWVNLKNIAGTLVDGAKDALVIVGVIGAAGMISGVVTVSGLGPNLSNILIELAHGNLFVLLLLTSVTSIILGMGLPIIVCYILLALLIAPALIDMGVQPLAAHLFIFYYGIISAITPPVAPDAFVAAGIAKAPPIKVAVNACRLGLVLYLIPYTFVYHPALLMQGTAWDIISTFFLAAVGAYALAGSLQGYVLKSNRVSTLERVLLLIAAILLITPGFILGLIGLVIVVIIQLRHSWIEFFQKGNPAVSSNWADGKDLP